MSRDIAGFIKKCFLISLTLIMGSVCACTNYADYDEENAGYVDLEFNNDESQLYAYGSVAATESGYYYLSKSPVHTSKNKYINFFDIGMGETTILCSKSNCNHIDENCDAYINTTQCLGGNIWYYNGRIYMMERTQEKDVLVSYDKNMRDKNTHAELSVDGCSINASDKNQKAVMNKDEIFYILSEKDGQSVYRVSLKEDGKPQLLRKYKFEHEVAELLSIHSNSGKIYMNLRGVDENSNDYICDVYDMTTKEVTTIYNSTNDELPIRGEIQDWNSSVYFADNNLFFSTIDKDEFIVYKVDFETKKCEQIYSINAEEHNNSVKYIDIKAYDGEYLYVLEGADPIKCKKGDVDGSRLYVIDKTGKEIDNIKFEFDTGETKNIYFDKFLVDKRYIFAISSMKGIQGLSLSEKQQQKYDELYQKINITQGTVGVNVVGLIDRKQIGSGKYTWINATLE